MLILSWTESEAWEWRKQTKQSAINYVHEESTLCNSKKQLIFLESEADLWFCSDFEL